jgi:hypothetical protein
MGFRYFEGKSWSDITRDERYFCYRLFRHLDEGEGAKDFIRFINNAVDLSLPVDSLWEPEVEVCFYRDRWQHRRKVYPLSSPKRTFDLCIVGVDHIIIIEAKDQQHFGDLPQLETFRSDRDEVQQLTGVSQVLLLPLASSRCPFPAQLESLFSGRLLHWREMAQLFGDDSELYRADDIFSGACSTGNSDGTFSGAELLRAFVVGERFWVGRAGGLSGSELSSDIATGTWKTQNYQVNRSSQAAPNRNWFSLADFASRSGTGWVAITRTGMAIASV